MSAQEIVALTVVGEHAFTAFFFLEFLLNWRVSPLVGERGGRGCAVGGWGDWGEASRGTFGDEADLTLSDLGVPQRPREENNEHIEYVFLSPCMVTLSSWCSPYLH